jgi:peroxiredoxin
MLGEQMQIRMIEFVHPTPFQDEINAMTAVHEGRTTIDGVLCDVIYVEYQQEGQKARWYFGVEDHLPRQVERLGEVDGRPGAAVLTLRNLEAGGAPSDALFTLAAPAGFEVKKYAAPTATTRPELIAVGETAPDWQLPDAEGTMHSLSDYRGKVVLLDFWATWCGPCKVAMPSIQKLHEQFKDRDVAVIGISTWERTNPVEGPAAYMKGQDFTYQLLVKGDDVAKMYKVSGIPTFYVIGTDGEILHHAIGFRPGEAEEIAKVIEEHLEKQGG